MAWAFFLIGLIVIVAAFRKKHVELWELVKSDMTGEGNFVYWVMAIVFLVVLGSIKKIEPIADAFLGLVILVIVLSAYKNNQNLMQSFLDQVKRGTA
jgi:hypothetical protein